MEPPSFNGKVYHRPQQQQQQPHQPYQQQQQPDYKNMGPPQPPSPYYSPMAASNAPPSQQSFQSYQPYYAPAGGSNYDPYFANIASEPMMNMAKAYGEQFAEQSKQKLEKVISVGRLKHYFDVDNAYVGKKLAKVLFPFIYTNWTVVGSNDNEPPKPRYDVNANDLYIPLMAIITYILVAGWILGTQDRFTPEQLGLISSSLLAWLVAENLIVMLTKYIISISQALSVWDVLSYTGYKYVGMIVSLFAYTIGESFIYYCVLGYTSLAVVFFLIRSVKSYVLDNHSYDEGRKRKLYLVLFIALTQPFIMWWLTRTVTKYHAISTKSFKDLSDEEVEALMKE